MGAPAGKPASHGGIAPAEDPTILQRIVDALPVIVSYWGADLRCKAVNRGFAVFMGRVPQDAVGRTMPEVLGSLYRLNLPYVQGALRGEPQCFERELPDPQGGPPRHTEALYLPDIVDGVVRGFSVMVTDITARKQAETLQQRLDATERLHAEARLAALTRMAAGLAHEINNPMAAVLAGLDLLVDSVDEGPLDPAAIRGTLQELQAQARRVLPITEGMALLGAPPSVDGVSVDLDTVVEDSLAVSRPMWRYRVGLVQDLRAGCRVKAAPSQLGQLLLHLVNNAVQAMPPRAPEANQVRVLTRREGPWAVIQCEDNGQGIPEDVRERVFEPFFSTRTLGEGLGLGLAVARVIAQGLHGTLTFETRPGHGSVFTVRLPAVTEPSSGVPLAVDIPRSEVPPSMVATEIQGPVRVVAMTHRSAVTRVLAAAPGSALSVACFSDPAEAIALLLAGAACHVVLCDLAATGAQAMGIYTRVTQARPDLTLGFVFLQGTQPAEAVSPEVTATGCPVLDPATELSRLPLVLMTTARR